MMQNKTVTEEPARWARTLFFFDVQSPDIAHIVVHVHISRVTRLEVNPLFHFRLKSILGLVSFYFTPALPFVYSRRIAFVIPSRYTHARWNVGTAIRSLLELMHDRFRDCLR